MAPTCPEEIDVFSVPHSRMKELVNKYLDRLTSTNFGNEVHLTSLIETLCLTFREFIAHEQIENKFIMKKLKNRMRALSIQNTAVCNCHKDNQLIDMLNLLEDGYKCTKKSDIDRMNFGLKLRQALEQFTQTFLPHMAEEEEVFQPLLMEHFSIEELKQIKATVLQQHFRIEPEGPQEKFVEDNVSCKSCSEEELVSPGPSFDDLSNEVVLKIFSFLNPKDLCRTAQVSTRLNKLAMDRSLWTNLYPVSWASGDWDATEGVYLEDTEEDVADKLEKKLVDEDADVDESDCIEDWDTEALAAFWVLAESRILLKPVLGVWELLHIPVIHMNSLNETCLLFSNSIQRESFMLTAMCKYLLPRVGTSIQLCDLAYSKGLTNGTLYKILSLCPNLEHLNLTQTRISDLGFKGLEKSGFGKKLKHLDLTGCLHITDMTLHRLAKAFDQGTSDMSETDHMTGSDVILVEEVAKQKLDQDDLQVDSAIVEETKDDFIVDDIVDSYEVQEDNTIIPKEEIPKEDDIQKTGNCFQKSVGKRSCCMKKKAANISVGCLGQDVATFIEETDVEDAELVHEDDKVKTGDEKLADKNTCCMMSRATNVTSSCQIQDGRCFVDQPETDADKLVYDKENTEKASDCKVKPKTATSCQNTVTCTKKTCCMKNKEAMETRVCQMTGEGRDINQSNNNWLNATCWNERSSIKQNGTVRIRKMLKCFCCGKIEEMFDGLSDEEEDKKTCFQHRNSNHGNQTMCCHGRASVVTDRNACHPHEPGSEKHRSGNKDNDSYRCGCSHISETNSCYRHINQTKGSILLNNGNPYEGDMEKTAKTNCTSCECRFRTSDSCLHTVNDSPGQESRTAILDPGNKDITDPEHLPVWENEIRFGSNDIPQESETYNDFPVQTEIPMVFIMGDLDFRFGMKKSDDIEINRADENCTDQRLTVSKSEINIDCRSLEYLSLSGCYQITDEGLSYLSKNGGLPNLEYLDLSGCLNLTGPGVTELADTCQRLDPGNLFYCDNILDGPWAESASGCQNLQCSTRICCRCGE